MRAHRVVLDAPLLQNLLHLRQRVEQPGIEHLLPHALVEPLDEGVLVRLAGLDVAQFDTVLFGPTDEFC